MILVCFAHVLLTRLRGVNPYTAFYILTFPEVAAEYAVEPPRKFERLNLYASEFPLGFRSYDYSIRYLCARGLDDISWAFLLFGLP